MSREYRRVRRVQKTVEDTARSDQPEANPNLHSGCEETVCERERE